MKGQSKFGKFFAFCKHQVALQIKLFYNELDFVQNNTFSVLKNENSFMLSLIFAILANLYGIYGLDDSLQLSQFFTFDFYRTNPYMYYHQMYVRSSWRHSEWIALLSIFGALLIFVNFAFQSNDEGYRGFTLCVDGGQIVQQNKGLFLCYLK